MAVRGWVQGCAWQARGSELVADAAEGATTLYIEDVTDFDDDPGMISINDELYTYPADAVDEDAGTITLDIGLVEAATTGDGVYTVSGGQLQRDVVLFVSCGDGDAVEVVADFIQRDLWPEGEYEEPVQVLLSDDLERIEDVPGRIPVSVALGEITTAHEAVMDQLEADLTELNEVTLPQVQADLAEAVADITGLSGLFPITSTSISDGAITTPKMTANSINGDRITANTLNAAKLVALSITGDKIAANAVSADKIVANSIGTDRLAANVFDAITITADQISGGSIDAGSVNISGANFDVFAGMTVTGTMDVAGLAHFDSLTADGFFCGATVTVGGVSSSGAMIDSSLAGTFAAASINTNGRAVRTTSSERFKKNIEPADFDESAVLAMEEVTFQYVDEESYGEATFVGLIAEQLIACGMGDFVFRDNDGLPEGIHYPTLTVALLNVLRKHRTELDNLLERVEALEAS